MSILPLIKSLIREWTGPWKWLSYRLNTLPTWANAAITSVAVGTICMFLGFASALSGESRFVENDIKLGIMMWLIGWTFAIFAYAVGQEHKKRAKV